MDTLPESLYALGDPYGAVVAVEAFNLFNHSNYGNYNAIVTSTSYGTPCRPHRRQSESPFEWRPRSLQFLARLEF